jgi:assimilatory nitrate reductase catalytic subunit
MTNNSPLTTSPIPSELAQGHHWQTSDAKSTCPYCGVGCGIALTCDSKVSVNENAEVTDSRLTLKDLKGDVSHPANLGKLCVKGSHLLDTNGPEQRLTYPSKHGNRVSWNKALDDMASHIQQCIAEHGPDSVAFYLSGQLLTEDYYIANKLMKGFIGSANVDTNSRLCMSSAVAAYKRAFGADAVPCCYEDLEQSDLLVLVGSNAAWTHPILFQRMQAAIAANSQRKLVVIDPRKTATSNAADIHLAIKPGTDAWVFNGLLQFLITNQLCDYAYIQQHTNGFEDLTEPLKQYTTQAVAAAAEIDEALLHNFYALFASADSAISFYSMGINQSTSGVDKANSIINCHLASGKIGREGSGPFSITGQPNAMGGREVGGLANMLAAHMDIDNPIHNDRVQRFWKAPNMVQKTGLKAVDMFANMAKGKIKFVWIMGTNPVVSMPNRAEVEAALSKCEMVVVSDIVEKNDTLAFADIVLPASGWSEKNGTVTNSERCISRQRGIMPLLGESKHDWQIVQALAQKLGFTEAFDYQDASDIFAEHAQLSAFENKGERDFDISGLSDLSRADYNNLRPVQWPVNKQNPAGTKRLFTKGHFFTPNHKANFIPIVAKLPEQLCSPEFPYILNTGRMRDQWHTMTRTGKAPALIEHTQQAELSINPKDAQTLGLNSNDLVELRTEQPKNYSSNVPPVIVPVFMTEDVKMGELFLPIHWSKSNSSHMGLASLFTSANDAISGQPELKHAAVSVQKVQTISTYALAIKPDCVDLGSSLKPKLADYEVHIHQDGFDIYLLADIASNSANDSASDRNDKDFDSKHTIAHLAVTERLAQYQTNNIAWLSKPLYSDKTGDTGRCFAKTFLGFADQQLVAYLIEVEHMALTPSDVSQSAHDLLNSEFIKECFSQSDLSQANKKHLLQASTPPELSQGRLICSCFKVRQNTIEAAIAHGCNTVDRLGAALLCGTNCGSCKSELASMIAGTKKAPSAAIENKTITKMELSQ